MWVEACWRELVVLLCTNPYWRSASRLAQPRPRNMQVQIGLQGQRRIRRVGTLNTNPLRLQVRPLPNEPYQPESEDVRAKHQELVATMKKLFEAQPLYVEQLRHVRSADFQVRSPYCALCAPLPQVRYGACGRRGKLAVRGAPRHSRAKRARRRPRVSIQYSGRAQVECPEGCRTRGALRTWQWV